MTLQARLVEHRADILRREIHFGSEVAWWEFDGPALPSPLQRMDVVAGALVFHAMGRGVDLHVEGAVSREFLDRLDQFQDIWVQWRPDLYRKVAITADEEVDAPRRSKARMDAAVVAFSGGVDGTATTWRHHSGQAGRTGRTLRAGVLIQGFDIPLDAEDAWAVACRNAKIALDDIEVPLVRVRTNWRDVLCKDWEMEFASGVLGVLRHWDEDVGTLLLGSCEEWNRLVTPWGSHPLPTQLLFGQDSAAIYDAGAMSRTAKMKQIAQWPAGYDTLRVCWQGEMTGQNCGVCEKCIRTKLNALAADVRLPASLPGLPTQEEVLRLRKFNAGQRVLMEEIVAEAAANGVEHPLIHTVEHVLRREATSARVRKAKRMVKMALKRGLKALGPVGVPKLSGGLTGRRLSGAKP